MKNERNGTFSSSEISKLIKGGRAKDAVFSAPGLTYIKEKRYESLLGRPLQGMVFAKATSWGTFLEERAFGMLPDGYSLVSQDRLAHPTIERWTGAPDFITEDTVGDIKCPYTLKSFCDMMEFMGDVEAFKTAKPEYYWQLVSNAILTDKDKAEFVVYVPYLSELEDVRELGYENDVNWLERAEDEEMPYLLDGGNYENISRFKFDIPQEDKDLLTERVKLALELL